MAVSVTITVLDQAGVGVSDARVSATLTGFLRSGAMIVPGEVSALTNESGIAVLSLIPTASNADGVKYRFVVSASDKKDFVFSVDVPNEDCDLYSCSMEAM
jgi:hypothetical protein